MLTLPADTFFFQWIKLLHFDSTFFSVFYRVVGRTNGMSKVGLGSRLINRFN